MLIGIPWYSLEEGVHEGTIFSMQTYTPGGNERQE